MRRLFGSDAIKHVRQILLQYAAVDAPVFISGETGCGKELVARALHEEGPRRRQPFVAFNCGAISDTLLQSELFGHRKGAFTGALYAHDGYFIQAGGGTVLLDEIGDTSPQIQVALLRVLETRMVRPVGAERDVPIQCRIVAASNANLETLCDQNRFRRDLLYRLKQLEIHIPPLRERVEDILPLAQHFLRRDRGENYPISIKAELAAHLKSRAWPGNVRELRHAVERMALLFPHCVNFGLAEFEGRQRPASDETEAPAVPRRRLLRVPQNLPTTTSASGTPGASKSQTALLKIETATESAAAIAQMLENGAGRLRRIDRVRALFREHKTLTRAELIQIVGVAPNTASTDLQQLLDEGFITRVEPTASPRTHYFTLKEKE